MDDHWCFRLRSLAHFHFAQLDLLLSSWMLSPSDCFQDFPVLANLASERSGGLFAHSDSRQQHRRLGVGEPRPDCRFQVLKLRSPLLRARRDHCPDPFAPAVPFFTPCPLRDQTVDHDEPDRLLRQIVGRLHSRGRDEPEITLTMCLEPLGQVATVVTRRHVARGTAQHFGPRCLELALEPLGRQLLPAVDHPKERTQRLAQPRPIRLHSHVGQRRQKPHVTDQVGQTEWPFTVVVPPPQSLYNRTP
jgi:hypothetical protein